MHLDRPGTPDILRDDRVFWSMLPETKPAVKEPEGGDARAGAEGMTRVSSTQIRALVGALAAPLRRVYTVALHAQVLRRLDEPGHRERLADCARFLDEVRSMVNRRREAAKRWPERAA